MAGEAASLTPQSCRVLADVLGRLEERGFELESIVKGTPVSYERIRDPNAIVDWDTYTTIATRLDEQAGPNEVDRALGETASHPRILRRLAGFAVSPYQFYRAIVLWFAPSVSPAHRGRIERYPGGRIRVVLELEPGHKPCESFFRIAAASFRIAPRFLGLPDATVQANTTGTGGEYLITPPAGNALLSYLKRLPGLFRGHSSAIEELAEQQARLQKSYEELAISHEELAERELRLAREMASRRLAETQLADREDQLRHAQKMEAVGRLAGGVAHDFNNMMTAVLGYGEVLAERVTGDPMAREALEEMRGAARRASNLTRQLLAFSSRQVLRPERVDLNAVIADLERMLARLLGPQVELVTVLAPRLPPVLADAGQLEQVVVNLAVNARDAMPDGGVLSITTHVVESIGATPARVRVEVRDSGCGMSEATRGRVFEPFFTTKQRGEGTGLGLSTAYGIIQQSGGEISVESAPGEGSCFVLEFPETSEETSEPAGGSAPDLRSARGSEAVLVVEDEPSLRRLIQRSYERAGYEVLVAGSGPEARGLANAHPGPIAVLVTDLMMRSPTALELASSLREGRPELRLLLISGGLPLAMDHDIPPDARVLEKPFSTRELLSATRDLLDVD